MCDAIISVSKGFNIIQSPRIEFEYLRAYYLFLTINNLDLKTSQIRI